MKKTTAVKLKRNRYLKPWQKKTSSSLIECKQFLGRGSFGSVYFVRRKPSRTDSFPEEMALKMAEVADACTLKNEKRVLSDLTGSPYVIRCYGDEETEEVDEYSGINKGKKVYNLFLEFCSGGNLHDHIKNSLYGLFPCQVRSYTRDIVRGLAYVHSQGIVHCDIKPDNILLVPGDDNEFVAKLADFGLAKNLFLEYEESPYIRGTWRYMSPELVRNKLLTFSADIWALGCVVVEMISAQPVWGYGLNKDELSDRIGYSSEMPEIPNNISEDTKDFLRQCLNRCNISRWRAEQLLQHPFLSGGD